NLIEVIPCFQGLVDGLRLKLQQTCGPEAPPNGKMAQAGDQCRRETLSIGDDFKVGLDEECLTWRSRMVWLRSESQKPAAKGRQPNHPLSISVFGRLNHSELISQVE